MVHYSVFLGSVVGKRKKKRKGRKGEVGGTKGVRMIGRSVFHRVHKEQTARRGWILKAYRLEFNKENPPLEIDNRNAGIILLLHSALPVVLLGGKKKKEKKKKRNSSKCDSIQSRSPLGRRGTRFAVVWNPNQIPGNFSMMIHTLKSRNSAYGKMENLNFFSSA